MVLLAVMWAIELLDRVLPGHLGHALLDGLGVAAHAPDGGGERVGARASHARVARNRALETHVNEPAHEQGSTAQVLSTKLS